MTKKAAEEQNVASGKPAAPSDPDQAEISSLIRCYLFKNLGISLSFLPLEYGHSFFRLVHISGNTSSFSALLDRKSVV